MNDGLNRVILLGNLGADAELRYTGGGTAVLNFRLATNESYVDRNKEHQERTDWHNVVVWGARAEGLSKILSKGTPVLVEGGLRTSSYDKGGEKRYRTEVHARDICLVGGRRVTPPALPERDDDVTMNSPMAGPPSQVQAAPRVASSGRGGGGRATARVEAIDDMPY